jgi:hypothetical protein
MAQGNYKYMVVAIDYFTKWIEMKPLVNIPPHQSKKILLTKYNMPLLSPKRNNSK